jgi:putative membrane protein insertion efficiency factor
MSAERCSRVGGWAEYVGVWTLKRLIRAYQLSLRLLIGPRCRFFPTCSDYALEALDRHGFFRGCYLSAGRLCRCRPGGGSGSDPVPDRLDNRVFNTEIFPKK